MKLIKENEKGKTYQTDKCKIFYRNKGAIIGDNNTNLKETIYLVSGEVQITLKNETRKAEAPEIIHFPAKTYHKIVAISDISMIVFEE